MATRVCKECIAEGLKTRRPAPHPGPRCTTHHRARKKTSSKAAHAAYVAKTYGLSGEQYDRLYEEQGGRCYICQRANGRSKRLAVDHDHATGAVRGLLCKMCNRDVLGHLRDSTDALKRAIDYLENPPAVRLFGEIRAPEREETTDGNES